MSAVCLAPMYDEIPGAVGGFDKVFDNGAYETLKATPATHDVLSSPPPLPPLVSADLKPAPPVKPTPKPRKKPEKPGDDDEYLHFA